MVLENAPVEVKLAVDLIYLLECNDISPEIALAALEIVKHDFQGKLKQKSHQSEKNA
ncbi:pleiotropic regulatory protein RsmS [Xenorhabdus siamensis]|uniref:pleiotropic regulatory protein RsmS n=1 Tax=Xenorhabdus siamensis TaxID=3136254 RepID=UPI0030F4A882